MSQKIFLFLFVLNNILTKNLRKYCNDVTKLETENSFKAKSMKDLLKSKNPIGAGAFGKVYKVDYFERNKTYEFALKLIETTTYDNEMLIKEIENLNIINSLGLLKYNSCYYGINPDYHDFFTFLNTNDEKEFLIYILTEYLPSTLEDQKSNFVNNLTERQRIHHYSEIFKKITKIHKSEYIHMDIKPDNIMSTAPIIKNPTDFTLKLIDFGLMSKKFVYKRLTGTPGYMYPPLYNKDRYPIDERVDIFSFFMTIAAVEYGEECFQPLEVCYEKYDRYDVVEGCSHSNTGIRIFKCYFDNNYQGSLDVKRLFKEVKNKFNQCDSLICLVMKYFFYNLCLKDNNCEYSDISVNNELKALYDLLPEQIIII